MQIEDIIAGEHYVIYTDGSCSVELGAGGWGTVLYRMNGEEVLKGPRKLSGSALDTTNNAMELTAALRGIGKLGTNNLPAIVYADSLYVVRGMAEWLPGWVAGDWWTKGGTPVVNADLWKALLAAIGGRQVRWEWMKGHAGHEGNELADKLAQAAMKEARQKARRRG